MSTLDQLRWQEINPFLDRALELPASEREAWLTELRAEHPEVAREVEALLVKLESLDEVGFLHEEAPVVFHQPNLAGQTLGAYTLEARLGRGGQGHVWLARRTDGRFEGTVAIKFLNLAEVGLASEERFRREGRLLAKLTHSNIARIIDAGVSDSGQLYLVLEHVEGEAIDRYCDERKLTIDARIELFLQVLAAVEHAHANLIVHRDIKPSNILVTPAGEVKLLDFGIAKLLEDDGVHPAGDAKVARERTRALTPKYAAPEQLSEAPITTATDVYSLGVLLYVLLCGVHPTTERTTSPREYLTSLFETEPPRLSVAVTNVQASDSPPDERATRRATTPPKLRRALQGDLDNIVAKALKKEPHERYTAARELAEDLQRYLRDEPVLARGDHTWYRLRKFVVRNRVAVALGSAALTIVIATAAIAMLESHHAAIARDRALALSERSEAVAEFLNVLITEAAASDKPVTVSDMLARSEALVSAEYRDSPEHRAAVLAMLGNYYSTTQSFPRAEALLRTGLDMVKSSPDADLRGKLRCLHAFTLSGLERTPEAKRELQTVVDDPETTPQQAAECLDYLALVALDETDGESALQFANLALRRLGEAARAYPSLEAGILADIGVAERFNGRNDVAEQFNQRALAQYRRIGRDRGPEALAVRNNWALVSDGVGNPKRAFELLDEVLRIVVQNDPTAPPPPALLYNRAHQLENLGRINEALAGYRECLAQAERTDTPAVLKFHCVLGLASVSHALGDAAGTDRYLNSAASLVDVSTAPNSPEALRFRTLRGTIAGARGQLVEARADLSAATAAKSIYLRMVALRERAELSLTEGELAAAEKDANESLRLAQTAQCSVPYSSRTGQAWETLGRIFAKHGDATRAHRAFETAVQQLSNTVDASHPVLLRARQLASSS